MPAAVVPAYLQGGNRFDGYDDCLSSEVSYLNDKEYGKAQATLRALQNEVGEDNPDLSNACAAYYFAVPAPDA